MAAPFQHRLVELTGIEPARLGDPRALAAAIVAAAGAIGLASDGPPLVRAGSSGVVVGAVALDGHILLHTAPGAGLCLVDIVVRTPAPLAPGLEIIARRLGVRAPAG
ncbi:MAG TPA: S-adenosylmethionine decarboxylase [Gemmatimonadales bacterium]|nr:S-adenosylmethionine decarboxylase [Gemmatimonadales bacterium]